MSAQTLPPNEPFTDFTNPAVREKLSDALSKIKDKTEDIPIVIGGKEFRTSDIKYQVCVSTHVYVFCKEPLHEGPSV